MGDIISKIGLSDTGLQFVYNHLSERFYILFLTCLLHCVKDSEESEREKGLFRNAGNEYFL